MSRIGVKSSRRAQGGSCEAMVVKHSKPTPETLVDVGRYLSSKGNNTCSQAVIILLSMAGPRVRYGEITSAGDMHVVGFTP